MAEGKVPRTGAAALALRLAGAGYDEVADALGLPDAHAAREQAELALAARAWQDATGRDRMRAENAARMERLLRSVWSKAMNEVHPEHLIAVRVARELVDRIIRLYGLDAPAEVIVHNPTQAEIEAWVASMVGRGAAPLAELEVSVVDVEAN